MGVKYIWIKGRRYNYHSTHSSWEKAIKLAKYYRKKNGSRYFILKCETSNPFSSYMVYRLYLDKVMRLGF